MPFEKANKMQARGRLALCGPSGSGKTYTALRVAQALKGEGKIAVIDTEFGSASKYANLWDFDVCELTNFAPEKYVDAIHEAESAGYSVIIVDSLTHAWEGKGGILEQHDLASRSSNSQNTYYAWREVTPEHQKLVEALVGCTSHLIGTMRTKTEYLVENKNGRQVPVKVGTKPVQRAGMEYEFDVVADLNLDLDCTISKTRCPELSQQVFNKAGEDDLGKIFYDWLTDGAPAMMGEGERRQLQEAAKTHLIEEKLSLNLLQDCLRECVKSFKVESAAQLPVEKLGEVLRAIKMWQPEESES